MQVCQRWYNCWKRLWKAFAGISRTASLVTVTISLTDWNLRQRSCSSKRVKGKKLHGARSGQYGGCGKTTICWLVNSTWTNAADQGFVVTHTHTHTHTYSFTLGPLGVFSDLLRSVQMPKREWVRKATGSYHTYTSLFKQQPWSLSLRWKTCLWAELQPWCLSLQWKTCPWSEHFDIGLYLLPSFA